MDVTLPNLGEGAESGTVVSILVKEGDQITKGQTILELENEKAVAPIPSTVTGTVAKIRVKEGQKLSVGQVILSTSDGVGQAPAAETKSSSATPRKAAAPQPEPSDQEDDQQQPEPPAEGPASAAAPSVRKIARELGIDLRLIRGSERGGRIVMPDLRAYIQRLQKLAAQPRAGAGRAPGVAAPSIDFAKWGEITKKPLSPIRKAISERMSENWTTIPHVTQFDEADITSLMELRKKYAPQYEKKGARLTLTSFALKVVVDALKKSGRWQEGAGAQ